MIIMVMMMMTAMTTTMTMIQRNMSYIISAVTLFKNDDGVEGRQQRGLAEWTVEHVTDDRW